MTKAVIRTKENLQTKIQEELLPTLDYSRKLSGMNDAAHTAHYCAQYVLAVHEENSEGQQEAVQNLTGCYRDFTDNETAAKVAKDVCEAASAWAAREILLSALISPAASSIRASR